MDKKVQTIITALRLSEKFLIMMKRRIAKEKTNIMLNITIVISVGLKILNINELR